MDMVRHDHVATDQPMGRSRPRGLQHFVNFVRCENGFPILCADREKNDGRSIMRFEYRLVRRAGTLREGGIYIWIVHPIGRYGDRPSKLFDILFWGGPVS